MAEDDKIGNGIPGMEIDQKYSNKKHVLPADTSKMQKELEKKKKEIDKLKDFILKKFPFTQAISILPPQALKEFIEEEVGEGLPQEQMDKLTKKNHLYVVVPEEKFKEISKIKKEIVDYVEKEKQDVWVYVKTPVDIWETCFDSKFEMSDAIALSYPLYDKLNLLAALRVSTIHKSLVLQKFDKYVVSYVLWGSLIRGDSKKTSDIDVGIIINDTDVKKMPRLELRERLRGMIYQYVAEASALANVNGNFLSVQVYLLTEFWESVRDAQPVIFTFIRDGVPIYDKATFMPWKALLKMGKLKPSPEAIDNFMSIGDTAVKRAKRALLDIAIHDIYWSMVTPSQALLMLNGSPPPAPKHLVEEMKKIFVDKEKILEKKYIDMLDEVVKLYKGYEHEKVKEIKGAEIDKFIKNTEEFLNRLRELRKQIEKRYNQRTIEQVYDDVFGLLGSITGKKVQAEMIKEFDKLVKAGKFTQQHSKILGEIVSAKAEFKKGKTNSHKVDSARKDAMILINELIDYSQRCDLVSLEKGKMKIQFKKDGKDSIAELLFADGKCFLFMADVVRKVGNSIQPSSLNEVSEAVEHQKAKKDVEIKPEVFEVLKKELGNFEIVL